jgi:pimeloyl-ACP methyl ester carboxylesterase
MSPDPSRAAPAKATALLVTVALALTAVARPATTEDAPALTLQHPATHVMRYHLALPTGWSAKREWPVLVVIPDAHRDFAANLERFVRERGARPYLLVAPEVLSCGGAGSRLAALYAYTRAEWDSLQGGDDFAFEDTGLQAVLADVRAKWHGEPRAFLTGWEAGGHTVWALALRHPERWRGVALVTTNYQRRGLDTAAWSTSPERARLPIQPFRCGAPTGEVALAAPVLDRQVATALEDARAHGFRPGAVRVVPGADHGPLPEAVLAWCDSLRSAR